MFDEEMNETVNTGSEASAPVTEQNARETPVQTETEPSAQTSGEEQPMQDPVPQAAEEYRREVPYASSGSYYGQQNASAGQARQNYNPYTGQPYGTPVQPPVKEKKAKVRKTKEKKPHTLLQKIGVTLLLALIFGAVSGAVILAMNHEMLAGNQPGSEISRDLNPSLRDPDDPGKPAKERTNPTLQSASAAMKEALEKAELAMQDQLTIPQINIIMEPAMVSINVTGETLYQSFFGTTTYPFSASGSGIIVGVNDTELLIATNNHVIADAKEISVIFVDEAEITGFTKGTDADNDLAIVAVPLASIPDETMDAIAYAELGDSDALVIGEAVVAVGNALGFGQSVTNGIVSALNRAVKDADGKVAYMIQTNAAINPGNSGGALVNMQGQVIGINSAKYSDESVEGMCFAIPINTALPILEELMARTTRTVVADSEKAAYLGIVPQDITATMSQYYGWPVGAYVSEVTEGSAADKAGIIKGDIITKFDGETISSSAALRTALSYYEAGETVELTIQRLERGAFVEMKLNVTLDKRPAEETASSGETQQTPSGGNDGNGGNNGNGNNGHSGNGDNGSLEDWFNNFFGRG